MITEKDFIDKMVEIAKDGYEYMDQLQCIFFTWNEFFNTDNDIAVAFSIASQIYSEAYSAKFLKKQYSYQSNINCLPFLFSTF